MICLEQFWIINHDISYHIISVFTSFFAFDFWFLNIEKVKEIQLRGAPKQMHKASHWACPNLCDNCSVQGLWFKSSSWLEFYTQEIINICQNSIQVCLFWANFSYYYTLQLEKTIAFSHHESSKDCNNLAFFILEIEIANGLLSFLKQILKFLSFMNDFKIWFNLIIIAKQ